MATRATFVWQMTASLTIPEDNLTEDEIIERYGDEIDVQQGRYVNDSFSAPFIDAVDGEKPPAVELFGEGSTANSNATGTHVGVSSPHDSRALLLVMPRIEALERQLTGRANFPSEEGETWSYQRISVLEAEISLLLGEVYPETPVSGDEVFRLLEYEAGCLRWEPSLTKEEHAKIKDIRVRYNAFCAERGELEEHGPEK